MSRRAWLLSAVVLLSATLTYVAQGAVRDFVILPLSFLLWQLQGLLGMVAQLVQWGIMAAALTLILAWQLVPELKRPHRAARGIRRARGQVETTALSLLNARSGNYFKWQLANRLGHVSRRLDEMQGRETGDHRPAPEVASYLAAGLDNTFVDFPPRRLFGHPATTALDAEPTVVVDYLESRAFPNEAQHADSL